MWSSTVVVSRSVVVSMRVVIVVWPASGIPHTGPSGVYSGFGLVSSGGGGGTTGGGVIFGPSSMTACL